MALEEFSHFFKESYGPNDDDTSGTSEFDESYNNDPNDCYCESDIFESGTFSKYAEGVDLFKARGPILNRSNQVYTNSDNIEKITNFPFDKVYFGSPHKLGTSLALDGPLFVTPYPGIASIFAVRPQNLQKYGVPRGATVNRTYDEWNSSLKDTILKYPLNTVHMHISGSPNPIKPVESHELGFIYTIDVTPDIKDHIYQSSLMNPIFEFCIDKLDTVTFSNVEEIHVHLHVDDKMLTIYNGTMNFVNVSMLYKTWSVENKEQYAKIARFWEIVEDHVSCNNLQGFGTDWTSPNGGEFLYGIIFKNGTIPAAVIEDVKKEFPDIKIDTDYRIPEKFEGIYKGKTEDLEKIYDKIWSKGELAEELEEFFDNGDCIIHYNYKYGSGDSKPKIDTITQESVYLSEITLEEPTEDDIPNINDMKIQTILASDPDNEPTQEELDKITRYVENETPKHLKDTKKIMYDNDRFIGIFIAYQKGDDWFIDYIFLLPEYRNHGIGRAILESEIKSHDQIALRVYKNNSHAISLYESLGFVPEEDMGDTQLMRLHNNDDYNPDDYIVGYRVTYNGIGIYEALKNAMYQCHNSSTAWITFINSPSCTWLPKPPVYENDNRSFFTQAGYDKFEELVLPLINQYIDQNQIYIEKITIPKKNVVYEDEYQFVTGDNHIQEAALSTKKRKKLKDSDFALVYTDKNGKKIRKYPVHDEAHVRAAARFFPKGIPLKYKKQVAHRILREARKYDIDTSGWNSVNTYKE